MRGLGQGWNVRDSQQRVRRRFCPNEFCLTGTDRGGDSGVVRNLDGRSLNSPGAEYAGDEPVGAAVGVIGDYDVVAGAQDRAQESVFGGEPGSESKSAHSFGDGRAIEGDGLRRGQRVLKRRTGRIAGAGVFIAAAHVPHAVLFERRGLVNRNSYGPRGGVRVLTGVDCARGESAGSPLVRIVFKSHTGSHAPSLVASAGFRNPSGG